ncbi:hypothetical protein SLE2022_364830 [Rubroshorea leprosula]
MATESPQSTSASSADSYIGSSISLISKSDIRYEGVLFHISPLESTIGLKNVRSFGTEGRRKDGPQILPSDRVYDYIYFRGSDIKDLQVLPSVPVQSAPAIPNDPAIIQSHCSPRATSSASLPPAHTDSVTNLSSTSQLGLLGSVLRGSMPQYQPVGNVASWVPSPLPNVNSNELGTSMYLEGLKGSSGLSHLQQQTLLGVGPPPGLLVFPQQQQMQYSTVDTSKPSGGLNLPEVPRPLLPPVYAGALNSTPAPIPLSALASNIHLGGSTSVASSDVLGPMANYEPKTSPSSTLSPCLTLVSPFTSAAHRDNTVAQVGDKTASMLSSTSPYQGLPTSSPSTVGTSGSNYIEAPTPSLVTPDQLLKSPALNPPTKTSLPLQTAQKDIEVVQASTSEPIPLESKEAKTPLSSSRKLNTAPADSEYHDYGVECRRRNGLHGAALHGYRSLRSHVGGRENKLNGTMSPSYQSKKAHLRGQGNGLYGTASRTHLSYEGHGWGKEKMMKGAASSYCHGNMGRGAWGRTNRPSNSITKFTEDFDFDAMNEKFNKEEVWGQLGKSVKVKSKDNMDTSDSDEENLQHEDADGLPKVEMKPVYVKDDFFDSFSSTTFDHEAKKKVKLHQQRKLDIETFGYFQTSRGGHGGRGTGRGGGWSGSGRYGRGGYGRAGRGVQRCKYSSDYADTVHHFYSRCSWSVVRDLVMIWT